MLIRAAMVGKVACASCPAGPGAVEHPRGTVVVGRQLLGLEAAEILVDRPPPPPLLESSSDVAHHAEQKPAKATRSIRIDPGEDAVTAGSDSIITTET